MYICVELLSLELPRVLFFFLNALSQLSTMVTLYPLQDFVNITLVHCLLDPL